MSMDDKTIILAIDDVEPGLVRAVKKLSQRIQKNLTGLALVNVNYPDVRDRAKDNSGLFTEIICDFDDRDQIQRALKPYQDKILAVTCRYESSVQNLRQVVPFLPYTPTPSESALLWSIEKHKMRDRLRCYDKKLVPEYRYLNEYDPADKAIVARIMSGLSFPVIVKPNGLALSILVTRCNNEAELIDCLGRTFEVIHDIYSRDLGRGEPSVLIEEMIQGDMYSVDVYVSPSGEIYYLPLVRVTTAHELGLEGFYGLIINAPVSLSNQAVADACATTSSAIKALNLSATTAHVELFNSPEGWKVIEVGPRIGGYREALYREVYGIDHYYNDLSVRIGLTPEIPTIALKHAAGLNLYPETEGRIESVTGLEEVSKLPSVVSLKNHAKPGDVALFASNGGHMAVDCLLSNTNPDQLQADLRRVRELIVITVRSEAPSYSTAAE